MTFHPSEPSRRRRIHKWTGGACGASNTDAHVKQPVYLTPAGAHSVQAVQGMPALPPGPHRPQHTAATSMVQLSLRPAPTSSPAPYPNAAPGSRPPLQHSKQKSSISLTKWTSCTDLNQSVSNLVSHATGKANATILELEDLVLNSVNGGSNVRETTSRLLDQVITSMDLGSFCGRENELRTACALPFRSDGQKKDRRSDRKERKKPLVPVDYFSKVYLYANSRMPPNLPALKFYPATYPLLRLAAQYSRRVYDKPYGRERHSYVDSDWRQGTKAMVIKSLPIDDMNTIVFAIRGTQNFLDWAVNVHTAPVSPTGFLSDPSNSCHAGFLSVARKMVAPVAARLRTLIEEDPSRMSYNLLMTGHSAGGAVASLLYLHLLSESPAVVSELTHLRGCFKHIHCVTFGAPPISLRPLFPPTTPNRPQSIFFAFINEGDPVTRADKGYFFSLVDLYASPAPGSTCSILGSKSKPNPRIYWRAPSSTLSNAGRLVLLRARGQVNGPGSGSLPVPTREEVEACGTADAELRGIVFGDPLAHSMDLYARRVEGLASDAVQRKGR